MMAQINTQIFREYDIRGNAETDLNSEFIYLFGLASAAYFQELMETKVLVGADNRVSSPRIKAILTAALTVRWWMSER
jgi:phosphomannomutase/phosphoglucomutase